MILRVKQSAFLFICTGVVLLVLLSPGLCKAADVTVDLIWKFPQPGWLEIEIRQDVYQLELNNTKQKLQAGEHFKIGQSGIALFFYRNDNLTVLDNPVIKLTTAGSGIFRVREPGKDWVSYRGDLEVNKEGIFWKLSNTLDQEDYLKGVVPIEMSNAWAAKGYEALKAQAVAARTYLLKNMDPQGKITDSPNVHQAYWGRTVEGETSQAVEATEGEILVDRFTGQPISIFYSAHNGGHSEETQNVWQSHDPHYASQYDPFSDNIGGYVNGWRFFIAADVLGNSFGLAPIREIRTKRYPSGRVYEVELLDWLGNTQKIGGGDFVRKFYPYGREINKECFLGRLYAVNYIFPTFKDEEKFRPLSMEVDQALKVNSERTPLLSRFQSSNLGLSAKPREFGVFVFNGRGWGHGVGMSQWGAYNMAMQGYSYIDILAYYYKNTSLLKRT